MDQIEEVRRKTDIVQLISEAVPLKKAGRNFKALCPFHEEKTPSFMVSPERQMFKCFGCFPAGELVKTPFGYHKIEDVVEGEYVVSGKGGLKKVLARQEREYKGNLVSIKLSQLVDKVRLTADHKVYVVGGARMYRNRYKYLSKRLNNYQKYLSIKKRREKIWTYFPIEKLSAGNLKKGMSLLYPIDITVTDFDTINLSDYITRKERAAGTQPRSIPLKLKVDDNLLKLLGYYIAEGSGHRAYIRFSLGGHEQGFAKEIVRLIRKLFGIRASLHQRLKGKNGLEITACNSVLANIFENLCGKGAGNKHVPFVFQQLPTKKQKILLGAIARGDGYTTKVGKRNLTQREVITTISRTLSEQITDMLLRMNFYPSRTVFKEHSDKKGQHHNEAFVVSWAINPRVAKFHHKYEAEDGSTYWILPVLGMSKRQFNGNVYNLTIEHDHSYVANTFAVANCGIGGDVYKFVMEREKIEFGEALRMLAERAGVPLKEFRPSPDQKIKEKLLEINHLASEYFHYLLTQHRAGKQAMDYLLKRGITKSSIKTFKLGFSANEWEGLSRFLTKKKNYQPEELERAGLAIKGDRGYYDRFRDRIMFPLFDHRGRVVGFSGRVFDTESPEAKYVNSPETLLYHKSEMLYGLETTKEAVKKAGKAVVVEGELDLISSYQAGVKNVVAIKGSALTSDQLDLLKRFCNHLVLALDTDSAGDAASRRGIELAEAKGLNVRVIRLRFGKDPDECAQHSARFWKESVAQAVPIYDFYIDSAQARFGTETPEGKRQISDELAPILSRVSNEVIKAHYIKKLAGVLGVGEAAVATEIDKQGRPALTQGAKAVPAPAAGRPRRELLEDYLLALVLALGDKLAGALKDIDGKIFRPGPVARIFEKLRQWFLQPNRWEINRFVAKLPEELVAAVDTAYLTDLKQLGGDEEALLTEVGKTVKELARLSAKDRLVELTQALKEAVRQKDAAKRQTLETELVETTRLLGYNHD